MQQTYLMEITPAQATEFLKGNIGNRPIRRADVRAMVEDIRAGRWRITHQGIALSSDMRLIDGQHRLTAVVEAGVPVQMLVSFDVDADAFSVIDCGRSRPFAYRLRAPQSAVAVAQMALAVLAGVSRVSSRVDAIAEALSWIDPHYRALSEACNATAKVRSSAPARLAAIARIMAGQAAYALPAYRAFVTLDFDAMPALGRSLIRQIDNREARIGGFDDRMDFLARAWMAFDPRRAAISKLVVKDMSVALGEIAAVLRAAQARHGAATAPAANPGAVEPHRTGRYPRLYGAH